MAKFVLDNAYLAVETVGAGATDLTSYTRTVTINFTAAEQDKTVMGNSAMARLSGLQDCSVDVEFVADFADNKLDEWMWNWFSTGIDVGVYVAPEGSTATDANPVYEATMICTSYTLIGCTVCDAAMATASFMLSSGAQADRVVS